jgi:predicted site-specific integrase-resolvase
MEQRPAQEFMTPARKVLTIIDYARENKITRQTVYNYIKQGKLKTIKLGNQQFIQVG